MVQKDEALGHITSATKNQNEINTGAQLTPLSSVQDLSLWNSASYLHSESSLCR